MKFLLINKNYREFLDGWWVVVNLKTRINLAFFKVKADAERFKKLKEKED